MNNYQDKEFKEIYSEMIENCKKLTSKWDPSISDESDPGVVMLKAFSLFIDKVGYKINYRNAQNSVRDATDKVEAKKLFYDLGYQMKRKKSATGNLAVRYIGDQPRAEIGLFTQFSNTIGSQSYTSIRTTNYIERLQTVLVKVQEGVPSRYSYEGKTTFSINDLTTSLRLSLEGIEEVSNNGIVICSNQYINQEGLATVSDWLNVDDNAFTAVETDNIFSIGYTSEGKSYIQFYEESLPALKNGIGIWIISSSGSAGNVPKNTINKIISELPEDILVEDFAISHEEFSNGSDEESIKSARENYYDSYGINNSLISERDYSISIPKILKTDLTKLASKALVTGVDGYHNLSEIVSLVNNGNDRVVLIKLFTDFITYIYVNALKSSKNYYESFEKLVDQETENLIKKAFYKDSVVSNEIKLSNAAGESPIGTIYNEYLFDLASLGGTIVINSEEELETIKNNIILAIYKTFGSDSLVEGELLSEADLSKAIEDNLEGIISASFYYDNHKIIKNIEAKTLSENGVKKGYSSIVTPTGNELTSSEKEDILARSILRGDLKLFSKKDIQVPPGINQSGVENYNYDESKTGKITSIKGIVSSPQVINGKQVLRDNEFIQFYAKSRSEDQAFGFGISYVLQAPQVTLTADLTLSSSGNEGSKVTKLLKDSIIKSGSILYLEGPDGQETINSLYSKGCISSEATVPARVTLIEDYKVTNSFSLVDSTLKTGTIISDGSTVYPSNAGTYWDYGELQSDNKLYSLILDDDVEYNLDEFGAKLRVQTGDDISSIVEYPNSQVKHIKVSGFSANGGLKSSGPINGDEVPSLYLQASQQITTMTAQKTELLAGNYLYILVLDKGDKLTLDPNETYLLTDGEHLIYGDKSLVDFVDFGSGTLISNEGNSTIELKALNSYDEEITNKLVSLDQEIKIYNTSIVSYSTGTKIEGGPSGYYGQHSWSEIGRGKSFTINENTHYGEDYSYRTGIVISTGKNNVLTLEGGQKIEIAYEKQSTSTVIPGPTTISFSEPIAIDLDKLNSNSQGEISLSSYGLNPISKGAFEGYVSIDYSGDSFSVVATAGKQATTDDSFSLGMSDKSYLLKIKIESKAKFTLSLKDSTTGSDGSGAIKILNSQTSGQLSKGEYQVYIKNTGEKTDLKISAESNKVSIGDKVTIEAFYELSGFNESDIGYTNLEAVYNRVNTLIGDGQVKFDFFYEPESPLSKPLEAMSFYDSRHILNRNILTVIDLKYLWNNLRIIRRKK